MPRPSVRDQIVAAGLRVMLRQGYVGSGVRDIVAEAGVPQGSFTNHFRSKEAFAVAVLDHYFEHVRDLVRQSLDDRTLTPRERFKHYLDVITERLERDGCTRGCLIGDFSLEAQTSELLRARLGEIFAEWRVAFAACIADAQVTGDVSPNLEPMELAEFLLASWEGAILRMKIDRDPAALERFKTIVFQTIFQEKPDEHEQRHHASAARGTRVGDGISRGRKPRRSRRPVSAR
jgi:TetR/AcrR family transcriptional regulator, transcriptional repressor for nem operon